ncbi:LysR family transcriptional regulator [Plantibacter flavus]|uniref:LysR family transcriptional regulator n=1 Tax=Plantibacter flavus TaxID=150123 RepID=UPI003F1775B0
MALNPVRLRLLEAFDRLGTIRAVGRELDLSPSTVSQQLSVLESETGAALLERRGRTLVLTPTGALLVERARALLAQMDAIEVELAEVESEPSGRLRIAGFTSVIAPVLIPAARALAIAHPRLDVELIELEPHESTTAVQRGTCDVVVTVDQEDGFLLDPTVHSISLTTDPLLLIAPLDHRVAGLDAVTFSDLVGEHWAFDAPGTYLGELIPLLCRRAGFEPHIVGRFTSYEVVIDHVAAGLSVGVLPALAIGSRSDVVSRPLAGMSERKIIATARKGSLGRSAVAAALAAVQQATDEAIAR